MRHSASKHFLLLLSLLFTVLPVSASAVLHQLQMEVALHDNGDADITEYRHMTIDGEGTESYIVISDLAGSQIKNFSVTDETGRQYINEGSWDVDRSRQAKAGRCGIVTKSDGYELCWGLGDSGERYYQVKYTITGLVRSYEESDGFNWMFVARNINPSAQKASITITAPDLEGGLPADTVKAWAFGFEGEVELVDEGVQVYTTRPMDPENAMIVMMEMPKGLLHPTLSEGKSFEDAREEAFEGSDYKEPTWYQSLWDEITADLSFFFGLLFCLFVFVVMAWRGIRKRRERKKMLATVDWYREIPVNGDLLRAKGLYNAFYFSGGIKNEDMISALILRLIRTGTLKIENRLVAPSGLKKMFGGEGKMQDCIVICEYNERNRLLQSDPQRKLYQMLRLASGDDLVLQPNELKRWMHHHESEVMAFMRSLETSVSLKEAKNVIDDVRKVFGLKKFLNDFTLANERHLSEVSLWNDYLVYATLFGVADQVKADMKQLNPEYLRMNEIARNLTDEKVVPLLMATTYSSASSIKHAVESRSSGGGGRSSFGGGGGSHGGGSGGGVR